MTNDSYVSDDMSAFIDETETEAWFSADDLVPGHLESQNEEFPEDLSTEEPPKMSLYQRLWHTLRSRATWREKARVKQERIRFLEKKIRDLDHSRENWRQRALLSEKQVRANSESGDKVARSKAFLKQTIFYRR